MKVLRNIKSHQFLDVLGFYSPIWWNLRNIKSHQFSPILGCSWILLTNFDEIWKISSLTNSHQFLDVLGFYSPILMKFEKYQVSPILTNSWMFLDSTHQFDEIWGISSLTNSHQFLDVLGFYSPILMKFEKYQVSPILTNSWMFLDSTHQFWWNLKNIKSHQFSPILGCSWILLTNFDEIWKISSLTNSHQFLDVLGFYSPILMKFEKYQVSPILTNSWMFLDSTHQFDEIWGISSLTNSHQFLDVLGFYSPILMKFEKYQVSPILTNSWMFLDSTHQFWWNLKNIKSHQFSPTLGCSWILLTNFDEIWKISSLTNSHQFLDVLGFYSPIWWNLRNIKSHQFSPILTRNIAINGEFPFKTHWQDLDRGELTGEATWEEPTEGLDLVFLGEKSWSFWCFAERFSCFVSVFFGLFYVHYGCFVNMKIRMSLLCCHERLKPHFPTGNGHLGDISMVLICINHSFSKKTRVEIWPMDAEAPLPGVSRHLGRWRESSSSNLVLSWDGHLVGDCPKLDISRHI